MLKGNLIKIAIVDDDEDDYFIITSYIKNIPGANLQVDWISDYQSALEKIRAEAYQIYFIDYRLGNETGLTLLQEAMAFGCEEPIVLLTGKGNREIDIKAMQSGAIDYLVKSELTTEKLERCIRYSLERTSVMKAIKDRENKYRNLFESSKDAVFISDPKLNFAEVNQAASKLLGYSAPELVTRSLFEFIRNDRQKEFILDCLQKGQTITDMEMEIETRNEEAKPCLFSVSYQKDAENKWLVHGIIHDITNMKRAELANLQAQKLAANERLMRIIAHEIRNPLNNINLSVQHFDNISAEPEMKKELVGIIQRNCNRINQSITELLDLTRSGELEFKRHTLQEIMNESIDTVADRISLQNIKIEKQYEEGPLEISADKSKLKIAFSNILINAIEAMEKNKGELAVTMHASPDTYTVSIKDNGIGISEENLPRLFEPFFTSKKNGMGLGLAACYSILQSHRASIQVESKVNKGTNFIINFNTPTY